MSFGARLSLPWSCFRAASVSESVGDFFDEAPRRRGI